MKLIDVEIKGTNSLLQHRFGESAEGADANTRRVHVQERTPREEAETFAYKHPKGGFYMPGAAVARLLRESGATMKQRGSRKSLKYVVPASVLVTEDAITLLNGKGPAEDFEVDSRPVVIPATKGRIMRHRPRFDAWGLKFSLRINERLIDTDVVLKLLTEGGESIGLGDFRPERGGPFGTFAVVSWKERS
jgi:hypothetical protein